jgi:hypothetical protein
MSGKTDVNECYHVIVRRDGIEAACNKPEAVCLGNSASGHDAFA